MRDSTNIQIRRGFTLIEMLVVVAIIAALIGILVMYMGHARNQADRAAAMMQLGGLQQGLQQYFADQGDYPPSARTLVYGTIPVNRGSIMLAQGLMGYLAYDVDGAGPRLASGMPSPIPSDPIYGFRTRNPNGMGGRIYGPYASDSPKTYKASGPFFIDPWGNEILYYHAVPAVVNGVTRTINTVFGSWGNAASYPDQSFTGIFVTQDNSAVGSPPAAPTKSPFYSLFSPGNTNAYSGGAVTGSDSYLLISAGPDGIYFTADDLIVGKP